jgi:hypothetical protein
MKALPSKEYLDECFHCHVIDGILVWKKRPLSHFSSIKVCSQWNSKWSGKRAGSVRNTRGNKKYSSVCVKKERYPLHRVIWKIVNGVDPDVIDHVDGDTLNNCIDNLRSVSFSENLKNKKLYGNNKTGTHGIYFIKKLNKWSAEINVNKIKICLGFYVKKEKAINARKEAQKEYGFHDNHGK